MNKLKSFLPDALVIIFFIAISLLYFFRPVTEGLVIQGHDHTGGVGAGVEMQEYYQRTGEHTLECGDFSFATACLLANRKYGKNTQHGDILCPRR